MFSVLIIDRNSFDTSIAVRRMWRHRCMATLVTDGIEGEAMLRNHVWDAVLLNLDMPNIDTVQLFAWLTDKQPHCMIAYLLNKHQAVPRHPQAGKPEWTFQTPWSEQVTEIVTAIKTHHTQATDLAS